ncbi:hypothetical protein [Solitalea canadensis]|uniref:Uncharacterized protein n=1 Tax=Solitalea canadensis (strain ATCC 29591 / DSM 3403 / JCM 21819 / LMG 8368 / NBRC 15130 / NCIMB 12057 / USAM 9D) TaxID=929556 RepID=H8KR63_SOLCM|nr:hypothetical protein [Solitalea canadensis]AFD07269.1 hypothetical protein Solca_2226 [Solitalea canadensis DSM 3403]
MKVNITMHPIFKLKSLVVLAIALFLTTTVSVAQDKENKEEKKESIFHIGFIYPVSNHGSNAGEYVNKVSFHVLGGLSAGETGFALSGLATVVNGNAEGAQIAGLSNLVKGHVQGFQLAGLANLYGSSRGGQVAGLANFARENVDGFQLAGLANLYGNSKGAQIAGLSNIARQNVDGFQFAGLFNKARNVNGSQFAGLVNVAKKVRGVQFAGLINIADSSDCPIALINIIKKGEKTIGLSTDETLTTLASFRSGGRVMYGILGLGYNFKNDDQVFAAEAGLGAHFFQGNKFRLNTELTSLTLTDFDSGNYFKSSLRLLPSFKLSKRIEIYAGPTLNFVNTNTEEGKKLVDHYFWSDDSSNDFKGLYIGYTGGIQFIL